MCLFTGLDEDLAEAIDETFFNTYVTWTQDNFNKSTTQKVLFLMELSGFFSGK